MTMNTIRKHKIGQPPFCPCFCLGTPISILVYTLGTMVVSHGPIRLHEKRWSIFMYTACTRRQFTVPHELYLLTTASGGGGVLAQRAV